jgi:AcrR family transcriptional regulator
VPKQTLDNIAPAKRERVLREAALLFAQRGYPHTDMAALAKRCGISKGSIYTYFESKEELYLYVCRDGLERSREAVWAGVGEGWDIYRLVDHVFRAGVGFAAAHPEYVTLYLSFAPPGMEFFAAELSRDVEQPTADALKRALRAGIAAGIVRGDLDVEHAALMINNNYVLLLAALVSRHFRTRLGTYVDVQVGTDTDDDLDAETIEHHLQRTITMIHALLRPLDGAASDGEEYR